MERIPFMAKIRNAKGIGAKQHPNYVVTIPAQYVSNGLVQPGDIVEVQLIVRRSADQVVPIPAQEEQPRKASTSDSLRSGFQLPKPKNSRVLEGRDGPGRIRTEQCGFSLINTPGDVSGVLVTPGEWLNVRSGRFTYHQEVFA